MSNTTMVISPGGWIHSSAQSYSLFSVLSGSGNVMALLLLELSAIKRQSKDAPAAHSVVHRQECWQELQGFRRTVDLELLTTEGKMAGEAGGVREGGARVRKGRTMK